MICACGGDHLLISCFLLTYRNVEKSQLLVENRCNYGPVTSNLYLLFLSCSLIYNFVFVLHIKRSCFVVRRTIEIFTLTSSNQYAIPQLCFCTNCKLQIVFKYEKVDLILKLRITYIL